MTDQSVSLTHSTRREKPDFNKFTVIQMREDAKARSYKHTENAVDRQYDFKEKVADMHHLEKLITTITTDYFLSKRREKKKMKRRKGRRDDSSSIINSDGGVTGVGSNS